MHEVLIIGNPNVGKSTLFNSLTKSNEHTGNFHGVTVEEKRKRVSFQNKNYEFVDLPGMYSLNSFSYEEEVAKNIMLTSKGTKLVIVDSHSLRKNLYLCVQMMELDFNFKILLNNYSSFVKSGNKINVKELSKNLNKEINVVNAKKIKLNDEILNIKIKNDNILNKKLNYLNKYVEKIQKKFNLPENTIIRALNGIFDNLNKEEIEFISSFFCEIIKERYNFIDEILKNCIEIKKDYIYGFSKCDKIFLNPVFMTLSFALIFFSSLYLMFFIIGPAIGDLLTYLFEWTIFNPFMRFIYSVTDNIWLIEFFRSGVFSSLLTILNFLPQVCLLFVFITVLEDSGIISRMAFVFDDFLAFFGLNGKAIYVMLLGMGCNTMSTMACRNMNEKNLKIKSAVLNPYISCMARLPVFVLLATAFFGANAFLIVSALYVLGFVLALLLAFVLNKTILPSKSSGLLLEFAPLRNFDAKHISQVVKINAFDMLKRIFSVVISVGIIIWILTHTMFNLKYTENITDSFLFFFANKISFLFAPIGLNQAGIVCALIVGIMAKELIVSTLTICNSATNNEILKASLMLSTSVVCFSKASVVSFLIFTLIYCPCMSNLAVLRKETNKFYMWFSIISQFTIAYMISFIVYQALTRGWMFALVLLLIISLIMLAFVFAIKKVKRGKCLTCGKCLK